MSASQINLINRIELIESDIHSALSDLDKLMAKVPVESDEEEKNSVYAFVFKVLRTDLVKLINVDEFLVKRFGFTLEKSQKYLFDIIDKFSELRGKYEQQVPVNTIVKKKGPKPYSQMTPEEVVAAKAKRASKTSDSEAAPKRILKKKGDSQMKSQGLLIWNSFVDITRVEMEASGSTVSYDEVVKKAVELKKSDPDAYKLFSDNWTTDSS
jgi:hypothetical protein